MKDVAIGLITIAIASVCASAEKILEIIHSQNRIGNDDLVGLVAVVIPLIISIAVVGFLKKHELTALLLSILIYILYCVLWWYQNRERGIFNDPTSPLGGEIQ